VRRYTLAFYEETILAFLDAVGVDQAVLVGGSLGGNLTLRLGHRRPERFPRLVAWGPAGSWTAKPRQAAALRALGRKPLFWPTVWGQSRFWYGKDFPGRQAALDSTFAYYREVMSPGFIAMYFGIAADQVAHSLFDIAPGIHQPVRLLVGELDNGAGMRAGVDHLHHLLPHSELSVYAGARHSIETEQPDRVAADILEFVHRDAALE
jgi:pimeloyl-ACP methyl ester carboxylesterase